MVNCTLPRDPHTLSVPVEGNGNLDDHTRPHTPSVLGEGANSTASSSHTPSMPGEGATSSHTPTLLGEGARSQDTISIVLTPPCDGIHKFKEQQLLYQCVHRFLNSSEWKPIADNGNASGTTWIELFMLFDLGKWRHKEATFSSDASSRARADKRAQTARAKKRAARNQCMNQGPTEAPRSWKPMARAQFQLFPS